MKFGAIFVTFMTFQSLFVSAAAALELIGVTIGVTLHFYAK